MTLHIEEHINNLLYHHECVIVSGLGAFIAHSEKTKINPDNDYFEPNKKSISFNPQIQKNDGLLANYIANISNISYSEACVQIASFSKKVILKMKDGESIHFTNVGVLKINHTGNFIFQPDNNINYDPLTFGLNDFYFPKIQREKNLFVTQYITTFAILFVFISIGFFLTTNLSNIDSTNTASFIQKNKKNIDSKSIFKETESFNELAGVYNIKVAQIDYDLYQIIGTDYHLSTKKCFKMGHEIEAQLKIYDDGNFRKRDLCFLDQFGTDYIDCYKIKDVYSQIPTSSKNIVVIDKRGRMKKAILVFEETVIDYDILIQSATTNLDPKKEDITSRFLDAIKSLSENPEKVIPTKTQPTIKEVVKKEIIVDNIVKKEVIINPKPTTKEVPIKIVEERNVFIIVGCFSSKSNATKLVSQLHKKGFQDACLAGISSRRKLFRVACSKFNTEKEANKTLRKLKNQFEGAWVFNSK